MPVPPDPRRSLHRAFDSGTALGVIEGFYGRYYTPGVRLSLFEQCASFGYSFYIYAPKNDPLLRREWRDALSMTSARRLRRMADCCHGTGMAYGFGISPVGLSAVWPEGRTELLEKTAAAARAARADIVAVLFDDVRVDTASLGRVQNEIIKELCFCLPDCVSRLCLCPTFYSFDPVLPQLFGQMPEDYFADLMRGLDSEIGVFWTGNKVICSSITSEDLRAAEAVCGRRVWLWDNYPVNDGRNLCRRLFVRPFGGRENLAGSLAAHVANPMNEGMISCLPLATLPAIYRGEDPWAALGRAADAVFGARGRALIPHLVRLCDAGLDSVTTAERKAMLDLCRGSRMSAATELRGFLSGRYAFDPACLTS